MSEPEQIMRPGELGAAVRQLREECGMLQADLARLADVSVRWLSNFERGQSPRAELFKVLGVITALDMAVRLVPQPRLDPESYDAKLLAAALESLDNLQSPGVFGAPARGE